MTIRIGIGLLVIGLLLCPGCEDEQQNEIDNRQEKLDQARNRLQEVAQPKTAEEDWVFQVVAGLEHGMTDDREVLFADNRLRNARPELAEAYEAYVEALRAMYGSVPPLDEPEP